MLTTRKIPTPASRINIPRKTVPASAEMSRISAVPFWEDLFWALEGLFLTRGVFMTGVVWFSAENCAGGVSVYPVTGTTASVGLMVGLFGAGVRAGVPAEDVGMVSSA